MIEKLLTWALGSKQTCSKCEGWGRISFNEHSDGFYMESEKCYECRGTGKVRAKEKK